MHWRDHVDLEDLVRRFDRGDRDTDLMAMLDRVAFDCFHAPWETLPHPRPGRQSQVTTVDRAQTLLPLDFLDPELPTTSLPQCSLPMEVNDETSSAPEVNQGQRKQVDETSRARPSGSRGPEEPQKAAEGPLAHLDAALESLGLQGHLRKGVSLIVELPYDPRADARSQLLFRVDSEAQQFLIYGRSDCGICRIPDAGIEKLCLAYNRRHTGLKAKACRPAEGGQLRVELCGRLSFGGNPFPGNLAKGLADLIAKSQRFWRSVHRHS